MSDFEALFEAVGQTMGRDIERRIRKIAAGVPAPAQQSESREARLEKLLRTALAVSMHASACVLRVGDSPATCNCWIDDARSALKEGGTP